MYLKPDEVDINEPPTIVKSMKNSERSKSGAVNVMPDVESEETIEKKTLTNILSSLIKITNLNIKERPISLVADNLEFRNIKNVEIKMKNLIKFKLLYDSGNSLIKKIKLEQIRKQTV